MDLSPSLGLLNKIREKIKSSILSPSLSPNMGQGPNTPSPERKLDFFSFSIFDFATVKSSFKLIFKTFTN